MYAVKCQALSDVLGDSVMSEVLHFTTLGAGEGGGERGGGEGGREGGREGGNESERERERERERESYQQKILLIKCISLSLKHSVDIAIKRTASPWQHHTPYH